MRSHRNRARARWAAHLRSSWQLSAHCPRAKPALSHGSPHHSRRLLHGADTAVRRKAKPNAKSAGEISIARAQELRSKSGDLGAILKTQLESPSFKAPIVLNDRQARAIFTEGANVLSTR